MAIPSGWLNAITDEDFFDRLNQQDSRKTRYENCFVLGVQVLLLETASTKDSDTQYRNLNTVAAPSFDGKWRRGAKSMVVL